MQRMMASLIWISGGHFEVTTGGHFKMASLHYWLLWPKLKPKEINISVNIKSTSIQMFHKTDNLKIKMYKVRIIPSSGQQNIIYMN